MSERLNTDPELCFMIYTLNVPFGSHLEWLARLS